MTFFFGWKKIKMVVSDLYETLGEGKSKLSSKRIERLVLFMSATSIAVCYAWYKRATITTAEIVTICSMLFVYAGFNTIQSRIDKKNDTDN